jgi:energy-coupling factor transporter ATP-binding protein EcfA2
MGDRSRNKKRIFARIYPPRPLDAATLEALLVRLASDPTHAVVIFEARSTPTENGDPETASQVSYWFGTTPEHLRWLRRTMHDLLPGLVIDNDPTTTRRPVTTAARVAIRPPGLALATERPEQIATAILSGLNQQLLDGEHLVIQLLLGPRRTPRHRRGMLADPNQPWWQLPTHGISPAPTPVAKQHDQRSLQAGFAVHVRFGVTAETSERRGRLLAGLLGGMSTAKAPGTHLALRRERSHRLDNAVSPRVWRVAPAAAELVGLLAWPLGEHDLPGLPPLHPKVLRASRVLAPKTQGCNKAAGSVERIVGVSNVPGDPRAVGITAADSLFHVIATGPTGSGKSTVLLSLIRADIHAGRPVLVIDPKRQLIDDIVQRAIPEHRIGDVVILDPSLPEPPGYNPLDIGSRDPDVVVDGLLAVFAAAFAEGWGPRTQDITHSGLLTLARVGQHRQQNGGEPYTLLDLPRLFSDANFRRSVIGRVAEDLGLATFWAWYNTLTPAAQASAIAAPANKWRQYLLRPSVRRVLGQPQPVFRLRDVFRENKIVLVSLNEALIGPITAQLIGGLVVAETWAATLERAAEHDPRKRPASVWIDEVQNYLHLPTSLDAALNAARSMGVSWAMAHQFRAQMPTSMLAAVDSNARNKIVFRPNDPKDAAAYARMAPELVELDFLALPQFTAYATLIAGGGQQPWCSIQTLPPPELTGLGERIRVSSQATYGGGLAAAAPMSDYAEPPVETVPIGRKRKQQKGGQS